MPGARERFLVGLIALLVVSTSIGGILGFADRGLLVGALLALGWQLHNMFAFDAALKRGDFDKERGGDGFWSQAFALYTTLNDRGNKHKRRYRRLLREVRSATNAMPDGSIILDDEYEILLCNAAAQALVGFDPRRDRGRKIDIILRDPAFIRYLRSEDTEHPIEIPSPVREGDWLNCHIVPYGENQRLLLIRDITERRRLTKMRRDFVANASHELRSPLTVISGYLDALNSDRNAPEEWRRPLSQMQSQAQRMRDIIVELIELSRLETSENAPLDENVDMCDVIARAVKPFDGREGTPALSVACDERLHVRGNQTDIESIVGNLVSNAVRHTPAEGSVTVTWAPSAGGATLSVADTGEGIAAKYIPRLTERFFRVDRGRSRADGGTGLGLAIVKYAMERHDALLAIDSKPGEGSTFRCTFPVSRLLQAGSTPVRANA